LGRGEGFLGELLGEFTAGELGLRGWGSFTLGAGEGGILFFPGSAVGGALGADGGMFTLILFKVLKKSLTRDDRDNQYL
jgi:hypothetical protein